MKCPRDHAPLNLRAGDHAPLSCDRCSGSFIQDDQIFEIVKARFHDIHAFKQLCCPLCNASMEPMHFDHGNLELDVCSQCRGIWFDGSEQRALERSLIRLQKSEARFALNAANKAETRSGLGLQSPTKTKTNSAQKVPSAIYEDYQETYKATGESSGAQVLLQLFLDLPIKRNLPAFRTPWITYGLIALCFLALILAQVRFGQAYFEDWVFYSANPISDTLWLSIFAHADWIHLLLNMWFLFTVGENVEDLLGRFTYLLFYLICGISAALAFAIFNESASAVGASGAISGVMGAYLVFFPRSHFGVRMLYLWEIDIPCWTLFLMYFGLDALLLGNADGVAHSAHLGGFVVGFIFALIYRQTHLVQK